MSEEPKVSVVLPVYNGERFLCEALDCILNQTFRDIEIICVDDGSSDRTPEILDDYAEADARVQVVHIQNSGVSVARNTGMDLAQGKYLIFCDDDDLFEPDMLEKMVSKMDEFDLDICVPNGYKLDAADDNRIIKANFLKMKFVPQGDFFTPKDAGKYLLNFSTFFIYKMYRLEFLNERNVRFGTQDVEEDALFYTQALLVADRIAVLDERLFYYRVNVGDSVSDSIYKDDILAGYKSILIVKRLMQDLDMYDDPDFHQSFVNRALTKTVDYVHRTKNYSSFEVFYNRLVIEGGLSEIDLVDHSADYFYSQSQYKELLSLISCESIGECLFSLFYINRFRLINERFKTDDLKDKVKILRCKLDKTRKALKKCRKKNERIKRSRSYRLGNKLLKPFRLICNVVGIEKD